MTVLWEGALARGDTAWEPSCRAAMPSEGLGDVVCLQRWTVGAGGAVVVP